MGVVVEHDAGAASGYPNEAYVAMGATLASKSEVLGGSDIVIKVQPPAVDEVRQLKQGSFLASLLQPDRHPGVLEALRDQRVSALALERIPRVTRAQKMDVLSSMANLAGYRAVVEAAQAYGGVFGPQVTAAGTTPPAKVLVIGAGVAGLAAVATARALGAEVRAFDTRAATREQVESLGAKFLTIEMKESGEGGGGYAKQMSKEFLDLEVALFRSQAAEVEIVVTTALVPGAKAPILLPREVVDAFKPGSVIVDMAAEQGGNCELCRPGELYEHNGVKIIGYTDLTSRMAKPASMFFATNQLHLLREMGAGADFKIGLTNDVVRPALLTHAGEILPPFEAPRATKPALPSPGERVPQVQPPPADAKPEQRNIMLPARRGWGATLGGMAVIAALFVLGRFAPREFLQHFTVFILACFVGWQVIWSVSPALHTPLMSVTNAISGIIVIGGMLQIGLGLKAATLLGALAVLVASINVAGGFFVTQRMLRMFHREKPSNAGGGRA
jgi:NAD(P) transhydrogenase subunit alpha